MAKEKTKIVMLEVRTELNNAELGDAIRDVIETYCGDFILTQKPKVQVAQAPKK